MGKYTCEKCGKEFNQKSHYTTHQNKKNPCVVESKIKELEDVMPTGSKEEIEKKANELSETLAKFGDQLYKKEEPQAGNPEGTPEDKGPETNGTEPIEGEIVK